MITRVVVLFIVLATASGCATVQPWERGALTKTGMQWSPDPIEEKLAQHVFFSKEASTGGGDSVGGGCGCN